MPDLKYKEIFRMVRIAVIFGAIYLIVSGVEDVCTYTEFYGRWPSIFFCLAVVVYLPLIFSPVLLGLSIFSRDADVSGWLIRRAGGTMWDRRFYYRTADVSDRYRRKPGKTRRNYRFVRRDVSVSDWSIRKSKRKRWNRRFLHAFVLVYAGSFWFAFQLAGLVAGCGFVLQNFFLWDRSFRLLPGFAECFIGLVFLNLLALIYLLPAALLVRFAVPLSRTVDRFMIASPYKRAAKSETCPGGPAPL